MVHIKKLAGRGSCVCHFVVCACSILEVLNMALCAGQFCKTFVRVNISIGMMRY
jgi:hypothetical protein